MNKYNWILVLVVSVVLFGCSLVRVSQDYDMSRSFSGLNTYAWKSVTKAKTDDVRLDNPLLHSRIRTAVDQNLAFKGYRQVSEGQPDFYVAYQYTIRSKIESDDLRTGMGFGVGRHGHYGGILIGTGVNVNEYDQGMLVINIIDPSSDDLLWRGVGTRRVSDHSRPEKVTKDVNKMVEKILGQFPPEPKG